MTQDLILDDEEVLTSETTLQHTVGLWTNSNVHLNIDPAQLEPSPELVMLREAVKHLTAKQQEIWNLYNYDRLTHQEIADQLDVARPIVSKQIKACEKSIAKWCKAKFKTYKLLKGESLNGDKC